MDAEATLSKIDMQALVHLRQDGRAHLSPRQRGTEREGRTARGVTHQDVDCTTRCKIFSHQAIVC